MNRLLLIPFLAACSLAAANGAAQTPSCPCPSEEVDFVPNAPVAVWLTTGDRQKLLSREPTIHFQPAEQVPLNVI